LRASSGCIGDKFRFQIRAHFLNASFSVTYESTKKSRRIRGTGLTIRFTCVILVTRLEAGFLFARDSFYVHLGLQIGLNFVPA
jgi:hypothetical protein